MCSGGGPVITMDTTWFKRYQCDACGKAFKAMGKSPTCPDCHSKDVEELSE